MISQIRWLTGREGELDVFIKKTKGRNELHELGVAYGLRDALESNRWTKPREGYRVALPPIPTPKIVEVRCNKKRIDSPIC